MKIKTYGIRGLLEKHCVLRAGNITMKVSFTNGTLTGYGVAPATYTTEDPFTQAVIENSAQYKSKEIILVSVHEEPDPVKAKSESENGEQDTGTGSESGMGAVVKVADKTDAVEWLKENHPDKGYTANKLRSEAAFTAACQECGVTFEFVG